MVDVLATLIDNFSGAANQTHCVLDILNLVVKSIIHQFDLLKSKKTSGDDDGDKRHDQAIEERALEACG